MIIALNSNKKGFIIYVAYLKTKISIYLVYKTQITLFIIKKVAILDTYLNFSDIFLKKLAIKLFEYFDINKYLIHLELD